jgi:hypothetical protein
LRPSNSPGRVRREAIAAQGAEKSRVEPGKPVENTINFISEVKPVRNMVDELEKHTIAERPYARGVALPA